MKTPYIIPKIKIECENEQYTKVSKYIHSYWKNLIKTSPPYTREGLFTLPYPYVVPGGIFEELFYWDSYFIILGLVDSKFHTLAKGIVENFFYEIVTFGIIANSSRICHLSRSQPPFLTSMIKEVWRGNENWLKRAYEFAKIEYESVWMNPETHYNEKIGLNRYHDMISKIIRCKGEYYLHFDKVVLPDEFLQERTEAESGWDYTSRFSHRCNDFIPVDLNSLLYKYEKDFSYFAKQLGYFTEAQLWDEKAQKRKFLMDKYLWDEQDGMYYDYDFKNQKKHKIHSLATFFPLWAQAASKEQAEKVKENISLFLYDGGMVTTKVDSGLQWDYPNGWAPLQWICIKGLKNYGFEKESIKIAKRWIDLCTKVFMEYGKLYEKYNVVTNNIDTTGRYPLQEGFGWTNGVYLRILTDIFGCKINLMGYRQHFL